MPNVPEHGPVDELIPLSSVSQQRNNFFVENGLVALSIHSLILDVVNYPVLW